MRNDPADSGSGEANTGAASSRQEIPVAADPIQTEDVVPLRKPATSVGELPTVRTYFERVGAEIRTPFRAAVMGEVDGYPKPTGWINFEPKDGSVKVTGSAEAPTTEEQEAITKEFQRTEFPKQLALLALADTPPGVNMADPNVFTCHNLRGEITMIHQRYETKSGGKGFLPWTRWSDGEWRKVEPEVMPFFGIPGYQNKTTLFIHEGAKAAKRVQRMIAGELPSDDFPWFEQMRWGHHIGWIGGVWAIDRSDWKGLAKMGWRQVVVISDNDSAGIEAAGSIAAFFNCATDLLRFDGNFGENFDCGDLWPADHFDSAGEHIGPAFRDCLQPYDRATDLVRVIGDNGRPKMVPVLRPAFISRYRIVSETQQVFCADRPADGQDKKQFNDDVRARSNDKDTYGLLVREKSAVCTKRVYRPDKPPGRLVQKGVVCWNAYEPANVEALPGDPAPFLEYIAHLFPIEAERWEVLRWLATLIARRDIRMHYSLLMVSKTQGVGKSTLGVILQRLLGETNVSFPGQSAFENQFNPWASGKLLAFVNEIYTNGRATVYDKIKSYVTDDQIEINEKNLKQYSIQNWMVFVACSNSRKALFLPDEDRRWLVPTVTELLRDRTWWSALHAWLDTGGIGIIKSWAVQFARDHPVKKGERPPDTAAKRAIVAENKSEGRLLARDFADEFVKLDPAIVRVSDVRAWIAVKRNLDMGHANLEKERLIIDELEAVAGLTVWKGDARPKIGGRRGEKSTVAFNFDIEPGTTWGQVEDRLTTLEKLGFCAPM